KIPEGVNDGEVRGALLKRHSIEVGGGLGDLKGKVWRVGLMGESSTEGNVLLFLSALGRIVAEQGVQLDVKAGIATASERLRGQEA
ncbi:MAG: alanine--glyoxylate aminotransferase family protein, partial [Dehalococcoidia bacterium]|nr:alanine--glyoxylate aminotransferase family protein [Dehalococcoidia bacterium]